MYWILGSVYRVSGTDLVFYGFMPVSPFCFHPTVGLYTSGLMWYGNKALIMKKIHTYISPPVLAAETKTWKKNSPAAQTKAFISVYFIFRWLEVMNDASGRLIILKLPLLSCYLSLPVETEAEREENKQTLALTLRSTVGASETRNKQMLTRHTRK